MLAYITAHLTLLLNLGDVFSKEVKVYPRLEARLVQLEAFGDIDYLKIEAINYIKIKIINVT